jgi:hypothetical protein
MEVPRLRTAVRNYRPERAGLGEKGQKKAAAEARKQKKEAEREKTKLGKKNKRESNQTDSSSAIVSVTKQAKPKRSSDGAAIKRLKVES